MNDINEGAIRKHYSVNRNQLNWLASRHQAAIASSFPMLRFYPTPLQSPRMLP